MYAKINLDNLKSNFLILKSKLSKNTKYCGVVKANAYGHGSVEIAKFYEKLGADYLSVARLNEAVELRQNGINLPILLLSHSINIELAIKHDIEMSLYDLETAKIMNIKAKEANKKLKVHIKIDTGMSRIGFSSSNLEKTINDIKTISNLENLEIIGIFSHFSNSDDDDFSFFNKQLSKFSKILDYLKKQNIDIPIKHISNSAGFINHDNANFDMVRVGITAYGLYPSKNQKDIGLHPVMSVMAKIINVKIIEKGTPVSYGLTYIAKEREKILTISVGYADGFLRQRTDPMVVINGQKYPVVGRICMDQCMVKVPLNLDVKIGNEVMIFGEDTITATDIADSWGSINYEVICAVARRVPRIYFEDNKLVKMVDYINPSNV
ncbi:alanine racemase [Campylobacter blaseri]|uniref:Alanine racemase n=1 Tax=Campylobacter blaseri TaxID=2042961 RepID=A0A2P8R2Q7_9BACT|nr:alanine racemase [Campylobacter blaseri]PSM54430.1 alanine racemase [Campylobacter blaseri]